MVHPSDTLVAKFAMTGCPWSRSMRPSLELCLPIHWVHLMTLHFNTANATDASATVDNWNAVSADKSLASGYLILL